jgi:hypothetical protein
MVEGVAREIKARQEMWASLFRGTDRKSNNLLQHRDEESRTMVRFLKRVWEDIRQGESIDVYVSVVLAIVLAILSVIDIVPADWIASVTLAVLALLAVAILGNRYKLEGIRNHHRVLPIQAATREFTQACASS